MKKSNIHILRIPERQKTREIEGKEDRLEVHTEAVHQVPDLINEK